MKTEQIQIRIPTDWSAVTLRSYLNLQKDLENYKEDDETVITAVLLQHLCNISPQLLVKLDTQTIHNIRLDIQSFLSNTEYPLQRTIMIGDKEYGFEPNLSKMSYGAYLDITKWDSFNIDQNWNKIMNILYRPIKTKSGTLYDIEAYKGNTDDEDIWFNTTMDVHFGAYFFFINILKDLYHVTLNSLKKEEEEIDQELLSILEKSGKVMTQLSFSQKKTYLTSIKYSKNQQKSAYYTLLI